MVDSAAMASKIWDTWVPQGTKAVIVEDLGNDEVLARKLMIFMAGIHDIGKATPVFQANPLLSVRKREVSLGKPNGSDCL